MEIPLAKTAAYLIVFLLFVACYSITSPSYIGDTTRYAGDAVAHAEGRESQFWEFGHLLWRPWAYAGHLLFGPWYTSSFGDTSKQAVIRFLIQTNLVCSALVVLLLLFVLRNVAGTWLVAGVVVAMGCATSFLNYSHSGAPYIPALLFSVLTVGLLVLAAESSNRGRWYALLAGVSFAIACALWFPYSFTSPGMLAVLYGWPQPAPDGRAAARPAWRNSLVMTFLLSLGVAALILFTAGAAAEGIGSLSELRQWILESDNGWSQSKTAMRAITGLARFTWDFGLDTVSLKRWLFSDPYNPAAIRMVVFSLGWKLALFYLGIAAALGVLWKERRAAFFMLVAAGLPVVFFAVAIFEPSSPERFLPVFPFLCLAFTAVLACTRRHPAASACVLLLLGTSAVFNLAQNTNLAAARFAETRRRVQALNSGVQPGALLFVVTFNDDLYRLRETHPLDKSLASSRFRVTDVVEVGNRRVLHWRVEFAERALAQWDQNREVWISERLLAQRPEARYLWVEGDDPRIRWAELPALFGQLEFDSEILEGSDGFLRLAQNQANRERMTQSIGAAPGGEN